MDVAAYVGTGQVTSWAAMINTQYDMLLTKASKDGDQPPSKKSKQTRPDPTNAQQYFAFNSKYHVRSPWAAFDRDRLQHLRSQRPELQASNPEQSTYLEKGMEFQSKHVLADQLATNPRRTACNIDKRLFGHSGPR